MNPDDLHAAEPYLSRFDALSLLIGFAGGLVSGAMLVGFIFALLVAVST